MKDVTEQLLAELAELRRENDELRKMKSAYDELIQIFDNAADGMRIVDTDHNVLRINKTLASIMDLDQVKTVGRKCNEFCLGPERSSDGCSLSRIMNGEQFIQFEVEKVRHDGKKVPCIMTVTPFYDGRGRLKGIVEELRDITDRKHIEDEIRSVNEQLEKEIAQRRTAEEQLQERYRHYEALLRALPVGLIHTDIDGMCTYVNDQSCKIIGRTAEKILGPGWVQAVHPEDRNRVLREWDRAILERRIFKMEFRFQHPDGRVTWVAGQAAPYVGHNNEIGYIGTIEDITERKQAEEALHESEQYNDLIFNGVSDVISLLAVTDDLKFRYLKVNHNFLELTGLKEEQIVGRTVEEAIRGDIAQIWANNFKDAVLAGKVHTVETQYDFGTFDVKLIPIVRDNGKCTHLISSARDISDRKQMEEYATRTEKLESLGLLAGGIAHDFNNILTAISGNISLARISFKKNIEAGKDNVLALLGEAEKAALQAKDLTLQLLTFAKGGMPVVKTASIRELLAETATFALRGSNVQCSYLVPEDLWPVEIDEGQISQVIHNLIINSDHAMPEGGEIIISAQNVVIGPNNLLPLPEGLYIKVAIKDHGIGIPKEYLHKIFDPYFTTKQKGSGLGLATAYSIISKHRGYIFVESEPGTGTVFYIYLPASQKELAQKQLSDIAGTSGKGRILVMDDEKILRQVMAEMLTYLGYRACCVRDGEEAIKLYVGAQASGDPFDAVIADLTIAGGMGGREAISKLKEIDPNVKAIVSSGYSNDPVMANYIHYGFKAMVAKPFSIEELAEALETVLKVTAEDRAAVS